MREFVRSYEERNLEEEARMLEIDRKIRKVKHSCSGSLYSFSVKKKCKFRSTINKEKSNG